MLGIYQTGLKIILYYIIILNYNILGILNILLQKKKKKLADPATRCCNYNKFYIGKTNRYFKIKYKEHWN